MEVHVEVGVVRAGLAGTINSVVIFLANACLVNEDLVLTTLAWSNRERSWGEWGMSIRDTVSIIELVASNTVAGSFLGVVHCIGLAPSTVSIDIIEARNADACE